MSLDSGVPQDIERDILDHVSDGILLLGDDYTITFLNETAAELLDVDSSELLGHHIDKLSQQEEPALLEQIQTAESADTAVSFDGALGQNLPMVSGTVHPWNDCIALFITGVTDQPPSTTAPGRTTTSVKHDSILQQLHDVAAELEYSRDEKIHRMLEIVTDYLDVRYGFLTRIEDETQEIIYSVGGHPELQNGSTAPLSETYCQYTLEDGEKRIVEAASEEGWGDEPAYERFGLECYLGVVLSVRGEEYGTLCFVDTETRDAGFDEHEQSVVELLADWVTLMLERQTYERELEQQKAFTESLLDSLPDPVYAYDVDGDLIRWNDRMEEVSGYESSEIEQLSFLDFIEESDHNRTESAFESVLQGEKVSVEAAFETRDETHIPYEFSGAPLYDEVGDIAGVTGVGRDITEQNAHQERLSGILETTRSLMQARDRNHVGELAANAAGELLDEDITVFRLYNAGEGTLEPIAMSLDTEEIMSQRPVYDVDEGYPGTVFASGEPTIVSDFADVDNDFEYGNVRSAMYYPVGVHGTLSVASTEPDAFDETDQHVLGLLATSAAAACMRAKRMQEIREAREQTDRLLDRVNGLVQNTIEVLVQARTRDELEGDVVSELAATDPYAFAWVGQPDVATERLSPTAWEGEIALPIEGKTFDLAEENEPVATAYNERTTQVLTDMDGLYGPLSEVVTGSDIEALVIIPLVYKDATYGVLSVCAMDGEIFDERERVILDALGRAMANAINAVERGRILDATEIIELEFSVNTPDLLFNRLSTSTDSQLEVVGTDYRSDGAVRIYLSAEGVEPGMFIERASQDSEILECTSIVEHENECLVELIVEDSLLAMLAEYGAVTREVIAENGTARFTVELPAEAEARELFELVEQRHPGTDLLGYHERERSVETRQDFKAALSDHLTDRQETALRTAYLGGFFDWPREVDGNELAEAMDIARPTYHQHLRAAQAKVFEELFE